MTANTYLFGGLHFNMNCVLESDIQEVKAGTRVYVRVIKKTRPIIKFEDDPRYNAIEQKNGGKELIVSDDAIVYLTE